jgi:hypothetical protein
MYDIYGHIDRTQFRLTVPKGDKLPEAAKKQRWKFLTHRTRVPKVVADEVERNGYAVNREKPDVTTRS